MLNAVLPVVFAVLVGRRRRELIQTFRRARATGIDSAKTLEALGVSRGPLVTLQKAKGVLVETPTGRYYLSEEAEARMQHFRQTLLGGAIVIGLMTGLWILSTNF